MELRTREDVRKKLERWKRLRLATLLTLLCFAGLQYYFMSIGLEMLSLPRLTVFVPPGHAG